jgi:hypothetical protein
VIRTRVKQLFSGFGDAASDHRLSVSYFHFHYHIIPKMFSFSCILAFLKVYLGDALSRVVTFFSRGSANKSDSKGESHLDGLYTVLSTQS